MLLFWVYHVVLPRSWCSLVIFYLFVVNFCLFLPPFRIFVPFSYRSAAEFFREFLLLSHISPHLLATFKDRWFHSFVKEATKFFLLLSRPLPLSFLDLGARSSCSVGELWQPDADVPEDSPFLSVFIVCLFSFVASWSHHAHHLHCIGISVAASFQTCIR